MTLETDRLTLREMTLSDFEALYGVLADSDIMQHYPYTFDEARVRRWIECNQERYACLGFGLWAMVRRDTSEMIGDCGLTMQMIHGVIRPEIGYHVRRDCQRHGYAKEAARACLDWTFEHTPFGRVYSYMKRENIPSSATARALGMHFVEEYPDGEGEVTAVYAITRAEWEKGRV